jgi:hypothetical protein
VFPNAQVQTIRGRTANTVDYAFGSDAQAKRHPDGEAPRFIASTQPIEGALSLPAWMGRATPAMRWRGKRLELSVYLRAEDVTRDALLHMQIWSGSERVSAASNDASGWITGTQGWTRAAIVLDVPPDATRIEWGVRLSGPGRVWMDEFAMEAVPSTVPTTSVSDWHLQTEWVSQYRLVNDPAETRNGHPTAQLSWHGRAGATDADAGAGGESAKLIRVEQALRDLRGRRVRVSAMIKAQGVARGARVFANAGGYDADMHYSDTRTKEELPVRGTTGWLKYAQTLEIPRDATRLEYGVRLEGPGTLWIDDLVLEVLP